MKGAGEDHWTGKSDAFHYLYRSWTGDCAFIIRLTDFTWEDSGPKFGIMFRATLDDNSPDAFAILRSGAMIGFEYRETPGGVAGGTNGLAVPLPYWLKLVRSDNT